MHTRQINFLQRYKRPSLDVLLKHMPEVEAIQFLDDVVDVCHLERKLKQKFPGDGNKVVEEVRFCEYVCACVFGEGGPRSCGYFVEELGFLAYTRHRCCPCPMQWSALGLISAHLKEKGLATISWCLNLSCRTHINTDTHTHTHTHTHIHTHEH